MASSRTELHTILAGITEHVYFQPPSNIQMQYPCIRYERSGSELEHADNRLYAHTKRYQVTVIDRNPDSQLPDQVITLPRCSFDRYFAADDLNHYVFTLFF
jgi:hypothetical protein